MHASTHALIILIALVLSACPANKEIRNEEAPVINEEDHKGKEVVIFVYHRFGDDRYPSTNIPTEIFEQHLQYLQDNKFTVMTFGEAVDYINDPTAPLVDKVACLTVDDGYKTFSRNALPLLKKFGYRATLFVNSESVGGGSYMKWNELKSAHQQGIEIGNHSHSHAYFINRSKEQQRSFFLADVRRCQQQIKEQLGFYPDVFAYPYGEFTLEMKNVLKSEGFKAAAAQNSGVFISGNDFAAPRFPMAGPYTNMKGFIEKVNMRALRIHASSSESYILQGQNPPVLEIVLDSTEVDLGRINCFTSSNCEITLEGNKLSVRAASPLTKRRTLYTVTAPSRKSGKWHWYSHLWIRPDVAE